MNPIAPRHTTVAGIICTVFGLFATLRFGMDLSSGSVDAVDYNSLLLPLGMALLDPSTFWRWVARIQLFFLALVTSATLVVFVWMSDESRSITFDLHDNVGVLSGPGIILISQGLFLAATLWIYFSIFAGPLRIPRTLNSVSTRAC